MHIAEGKSNKEDQYGNDRIDKNADKGVEEVAGRGFVVLGKWLEQRHKDYCEIMGRIQKVVAAVTIAEKEERSRGQQIQKALLGYDPEVWMETNCELRTEDETKTEYVTLEMPPPINGKHKYRFCQIMYFDIHAFMQNREWAAAKSESETSGITWAELFALYDTGGYRTANGGEHIKDQEAKKRAEARKGQGSTKKKKHEKDAAVRPTYGQELNRFKGIMRNIANHEVAQDHTKWFKMEGRQKLRRLAMIGIKGHQPAIAALCKMSEEE